MEIYVPSDSKNTNSKQIDFCVPYFFSFMSVVRCITKLPVCRIEGTVVHGFKRGSTLLDCPTANICTDHIQDAIKGFKKGVYYGWASLHGTVYKMVANIGVNPSFGNEHISVEVHLLHEFSQDFYDENLKVLILGSIRTESKFSSLDELKTAIHEDCGIAEKLLDDQEYSSYKSDSFFMG